MHQPGIRPDTQYLPALDGLRAGSVLLVMLFHMGLQPYIPGSFGVTVFFFISGFLITRLLLAEHEQHGHIGLKSFYIRRVFRLLPAQYFTIVLVAITVTSLGHNITWQEVAAGFTYSANYFYIFAERSAWGDGHLRFLWSLAVEEHFYLLFPLSLVLLLRRASYARITALLFALAGAVLLWRLYVWYGTMVGGSDDFREMRVYYATDTRIDSILYGCALSVLLASQHAARALKILLHPIAFVLGIAVILTSLANDAEAHRNTLRYTLHGLGLMPIVCSLVFATWAAGLRWILTRPPIVWVGKLSYSLYLTHLNACFIGDQVFPGAQYSAGWYGVAVPLALIHACVCYYAVERPCIRLRKRFAAH